MSNNFASAQIAGIIAAKPVRVRGELVGEETVVARLANHRSRRDAGGGRVEATDWYVVRFRGELAAMAERLDSGDEIVVHGELEQEPFRREDGETGVDVIICVDRAKFITVGGRTRREMEAARGSASNARRREPEGVAVVRVPVDGTIDYGAVVERRSS